MRRRVDRELSQEIEHHIAEQAAELEHDGVTREEALRRARIAFGSVVACEESVRESVGLKVFDEVRADVRYTFRGLLTSPGFAAIAILSLALGIGANTAIFSMAKAALLDKLAVPHPDELRLLGWSQPLERQTAVQSSWSEVDVHHGGKRHTTVFSYPVFQYLAANTSQMQIFGVKPMERAAAVWNNSAETWTVELLSGNAYQVLRVAPALGRGIIPADDHVGAPLAAVISDGLWQRAFGRDPNVLGRQVKLNSQPVTIVGVNSPDFTGIGSTQFAADVYLPLTAEPQLDPSQDPIIHDSELWWVDVMGRMESGATDEQAFQEYRLNLINAVRLILKPHKNAARPEPELLPGSQGLRHPLDDDSKPVKVLFAVVGFVLLLACVNIANLMLVRAVARRREFSTRLALGASRERIVRQGMTESLCIATLGGVAGLVISFFTRNAIPHLMNERWGEHVHGRQTDFDAGVFLFIAAVTVLCGLLFGFLPALNAGRADLYSATKRMSRSSITGRALVALQVALSLTLVIGAVLFVRTLGNIESQPLGFNPHDVVLFGLAPSGRSNAGVAAQRELHRIEQGIAAIPGVEAAGMSQHALIAGAVSSFGFQFAGNPHQQISTARNIVSAGFFDALRIPILRGRNFRESDAAGPLQAVIVNQQFAKEFGDPIGRKMVEQDEPDRMIIGVCGDAKYRDAKEAVEPTAYLYQLNHPRNDGAIFEVRTKLPMARIVPELRRAVAAVDRELPLIDIRTQDEQIAAREINERLFASLASTFGILALAIAAIGIYGLMAFSVAKRANEIGIRMALGAKPSTVVRMMLGEFAWPVSVGIAFGCTAALVLLRLVKSFLFGVKANDPVTLIVSALLLLVVALAAAWIPTRRAASINPTDALRCE